MTKIKHKLAICIPAVNCLEYSKQTIDSIKTKHDYQIFFVDNGSTDGTKQYLAEHSEIISFIDPKVSGLAASWNMMIKEGFENYGCTLALVLNNDIVLAPNTIDNMVERFEKGDVLMVTGVNVQGPGPEGMLKYQVTYFEEEPNNHPDYSCFLISEVTISRIGWFDENFVVAYFEDGDYAARMALAGESATSTLGGSYYHFCSKTVKENLRLQSMIHDAFRRNRDFFVKKWGCEPLGDVPKMVIEYYKTPFNSSNRDIKNIDPYFNLEF